MNPESDSRPGVNFNDPDRPPLGDYRPRRTSRKDLLAWARGHFRGKKLVVVSNREPYTHVREAGEVKVHRNVGGLTVALDSVAQALGGVWVAYGHGSADKATVDANDRVACPPDNPSYTLRRVWLTREDTQKYYSGFSNGTLWPLCHIVYVRPRFKLNEWERYCEVNRRFAEAVLKEVEGEQAFIFIQDYHLALVAKYIKEKRPDLDTALFWHIPWPTSDVFRILPWREEFLDGMLANDLIGFHIRAHALNFLENVSNLLEARVDDERLAVDRGGNRTWIRSFPISVNAEEVARIARSDATAEAKKRIEKHLALGDSIVGVGVDRMDYTKGIPDRFEALERLFEKYPEWIGRLTFIQIGVPTRVELREYRDVMTRTRALTKRINEKYPRKGEGASAKTVHLIEANLDFRDVVPYLTLADFCAVTSLHDGMNLVAKEYVAAKTDLDGALILSPFAGAARELERAWICSPYDRESLADTYHYALTEPAELRRERMAALRETVLRHNIYDWAMELFDTLQRLALRTPTDPVEMEWRGR